MPEHWKWFYERANKRDEAEASLADILDVKASILLVIVVFLATLIPDVLRISGLSSCIRIFQLATGVVLSAGVALALRHDLLGAEHPCAPVGAAAVALFADWPLGGFLFGPTALKGLSLRRDLAEIVGSALRGGFAALAAERDCMRIFPFYHT